MKIWKDTRSIESVISDPGIDPAVKEKLNQVLEIRAFAADQLHLPDNESYTEFVDLQRPYAVWSVFAAPELSLEPTEWCFLIVGCVTYRGYFEEESARRFAQELSGEGLDVYVGGVPAYSTLGWFDDPVPSTVLHYSEINLAALIFHELAHQVAFAKGDTVFNESFATAVERAGVERWLAISGNIEKVADYHIWERRNEAVVDLILDYRERLRQLYASDADNELKRSRKEVLIVDLRSAYQEMIKPWGTYSGYRNWFDQPINNAKLVSVSTYNDLVPAFASLLDQHDGNLSAFYKSVRQLADKPRIERRAALGLAAPRSSVQ